MEMRTLGKTGLEVSVMGFGGAPIGYLDETVDRVQRVLNRLLDAGVNLVDTAACYPGSEELIAKAIGNRRDDYVLVTKCGHRAEDIEAPEWSPELIGESIDRSLRLLETDYIDVALLHSCDREVLQQGDALGALVRSRDAGKVRFIGYSGDNETAAHAMSIPDIAVLQTSVNICDQANIDLAIPAAVENNAGVLAKRPLANAAWKAPALQRGIYRSYSEPYSKRLSLMHLEPGSLGFNGLHDEELHRIALRFTLSVPGVDCALVGTTNPAHVETNLRVIAEGPLPEDVYAAVRKAFSKAEGEAKTKWQGLT
jgi:aryl-alcohol dehydrogenase-like predicted oxidoreductase